MAVFGISSVYTGLRPTHRIAPAYFLVLLPCMITLFSLPTFISLLRNSPSRAV